MINYNNHNITAITYNNHHIKYVYGCGGNLVWSGDTPTPPTPTGFKYILTLDDSSVVSAECDSTSAIGRDEVSAYSAQSISLEVGDCVTTIGECQDVWCGAFSYFRNLTSVTFSDSVTTIGNSSFNYCSGLTSVEIPDSVTSLDDYSFAHCTSLTSATIGSGVTSINFASFTETGLYEIIIPNNITAIGNIAYAGCSAATSCTIGSGVTSIGGSAFQDCSSLTSITINATVPPTLGVWNYKYEPFENTNDCPLLVPAGSVEAYKTATHWSQYASRIEAIS